MNRSILRLLAVLILGVGLVGPATAWAAGSPPTADPQSVTAQENPLTKTITLSGSDADGETLTFTVTVVPTWSNQHDDTGAKLRHC